MFIPSWVIIPLVSIIIILLIASVYMFCYMKNRVNSISEKLVDISQDLKNCAGKVNSEPKSINGSTSIEDKFSTSILSYVRDINVCVVFFTFIMSAVFFFLGEKNGLENSTFNNITLIVFITIGLLPSAALLLKLFSYGIKTRHWWQVIGFLIVIFCVTIIIFSLLNFSFEKLIPDVMKILQDSGAIK